MNPVLSGAGRWEISETSWYGWAFIGGLNCVLESPVAGDSAYTQTGFNYILDIS